MPRNTREWCLREIKSISNHIANIGVKCEIIIETYKPQHPEIAKGFEILLDLQEQCLKIAEAIKSQI